MPLKSIWGQEHYQSKSSDDYNFGIILYEILAGQIPYSNYHSTLKAPNIPFLNLMYKFSNDNECPVFPIDHRIKQE